MWDTTGVIVFNVKLKMNSTVCPRLDWMPAADYAIMETIFIFPLMVCKT